AGFVAGGFDLPEAKQGFVWEGKDSLLLATDWGGDTVTESGYPFVVKRLKRGQNLSEAQELFRGDKENVGVWPMSLQDEHGKEWFGVSQAETFFTSNTYVFGADGKAMQLPIPKK